MRHNLIALSAALFFMLTQSAEARPLLSAAEDLAEGIEHLDTELHRVNAPHDAIELVHHSEETVFEFVDLIVNNAPPKAISFEFNHIRTDVREIRRMVRRYNYFNCPRVRAEFWHVWTAYRYLDHAYFHGGGHWGGH